MTQQFPLQRTESLKTLLNLFSTELARQWPENSLTTLYLKKGVFQNNSKGELVIFLDHDTLCCVYTYVNMYVNDRIYYSELKG